MHGGRKLMSLLGALAVAVLFAACGDSSSDEGGKAGDAPSTIRLGATLPLTGPGAAYGTVMKNGLQLAVDEINRSGGVKGSKLQLIALDDQAQAGPAVSTAKQLINVNKVVAIASAFTVPPLAQLPLAERSKVPVFNGGGYDPSLLGHDLLYNNILTLGQEAKAGMQYAKDKLGARKLGLVVETDLTADGVDKVKGLWQEVSGTASTNVTIDQTATNAGSQLDKVLAGNPDALYLATDGNISSLLYKQLAQRNVKIPIISSSASLAVPEATKSPSLRLVFSRQAFKPGPAFEKAYNAKYHEPPNIYFVNYFNIAYVVKQGLEHALANGGDANGEGLQKALGDVQGFTGCCGKLSFTSEHGSTDPAEIVEIDAGKPKVLAAVPTK